ncbi:MAG: hypothetical protein RLZZ491_695 [Pseudomonadota bacterium]|jgi:SlyX protein
MTDLAPIEERIAHLERTTDELSEVVARQDAEIRRLSQRVEMLLAREVERALDQGATIPLGDQKPPHW